MNGKIKKRYIITEFGIGETYNEIVEEDYFENELRNVELGNIILMSLPRNGETYYVNPKFIANVEVHDVGD
ncbi:hypothetical protein [uncultured Dubosiella sp.]|uniref:hypothetical protein n=1 Tax=uncultured Dubosiella sp. TaxID=1937011 RepID=UPI00272E61A6|nr:hypothetical protein [uncultured Dubosiella sp.]